MRIWIVQLKFFNSYLKIRKFTGISLILLKELKMRQFYNKLSLKLANFIKNSTIIFQILLKINKYFEH